MNITTALFDQEEVLRRYHIELRDEGKREGKLEGKREGKLEGKREGKLEGKREGKREAINAVMQNLNCDREKAMDILNITGKERENMNKLLNTTKTGK